MRKDSETERGRKKVRHRRKIDRDRNIRTEKGRFLPDIRAQPYLVITLVTEEGLTFMLPFYVSLKTFSKGYVT